MPRARFELEASGRERFRMFSTLAFVFFQSDVKNIICLDSCLARCSAKWRVSKNHILRTSTSSSRTLNWFSSNMRLTSSFVRAALAFGLFPLRCFLQSSRRLHFRTSLDTLNSSSLRMFPFAFFSSRNSWILRENEDFTLSFYFELSFFCAVIWKLHSSLSSSSGKICMTFRFSPLSFRNLWNTFISQAVFFTVFACCWLVINFLISWFESSVFLSVASLWAGNCSIRRPKAHRDNRTHCRNVRFYSFSRKSFLATKWLRIFFAGAVCISQ